jgi:hypothetical protein
MADWKLIKATPADGPLWHQPVHQLNKPRIMSRLQEMDHFVKGDVFEGH